ncbi:hypothetical protein AUP68_03199 [Ilyonectria robusta]
MYTLAAATRPIEKGDDVERAAARPVVTMPRQISFRIRLSACPLAHLPLSEQPDQSISQDRDICDDFARLVIERGRIGFPMYHGWAFIPS